MRRAEAVYWTVWAGALTLGTVAIHFAFNPPSAAASDCAHRVMVVEIRCACGRVEHTWAAAR